MGKTNFDDLELGDRAIEAREIGSENATDGQVLTADGSGGAAWEDAAGGATKMVGTALIGGDFTGNARGANAVDLQTGHSDPSFVASGAQAIAIGQDAKASGYTAIAIGGNLDGVDYVTKAEGDYAIAIGGRASAAAYKGVALGNGANAGGAGSTAVGQLAVASGAGAVAIGGNVYATNTNALALGQEAQASGARAIAIGPEVQNSTGNSVKIGWNNTNGFAHFTTFTPTSGTPAASHYLPVNLGGTVYKFLLAT